VHVTRNVQTCQVRNCFGQARPSRARGRSTQIRVKKPRKKRTSNYMKVRNSVLWADMLNKPLDRVTAWLGGKSKRELPALSWAHK
jgi:hypothetical protein